MELFGRHTVEDRVRNGIELAEEARQAREYIIKHPSAMRIRRNKRYSHVPSKYANSKFSHAVSQTHPWHFSYFGGKG